MTSVSDGTISCPCHGSQYNIADGSVKRGPARRSLKELAATTGGHYFREEDLHKLPELISAKTERVRSPMEVEMWASPLYFLLMLGVVSAEWVLRKLSHLK